MRTRLQIAADRAAEVSVRAIGEQLRHLREDAGLPRTVVARSAMIHPSHLRLIELGRREASISVLTRVAGALGADLSIRAFPNTGAPLRDRFQARMIEALLRLIPREWESFPEVGVTRPVRGFIDLVIARSVTRDVVAIEAHSEIRRLEQQLRWAGDKAAALPSSAAWSALTLPFDGQPVISRVLLLRSTGATRAIAHDFAETLRAVYPAEPAAIHAALLDPRRPWPGNGILWVNVDGTRTSILSGKPRGLSR